MMLRIVCGFAIITGCGYIGIVLASEHDAEIAQIRQFIDALKFLEVEIALSGRVLSDALRASGENVSGAAAAIFKEAADRLEEAGNADIKEVWQTVIEENKNRLCLKTGTIEVIKGMSAMLGCGTRETESDNIRAVCQKLRLAEEDAMRRKASGAGLKRGLGLASGVLITVLLL